MPGNSIPRSQRNYAQHNFCFDQFTCNFVDRSISTTSHYYIRLFLQSFLGQRYRMPFFHRQINVKRIFFIVKSRLQYFTNLFQSETSYRFDNENDLHLFTSNFLVVASSFWILIRYDLIVINCN